MVHLTDIVHKTFDKPDGYWTSKVMVSITFEMCVDYYYYEEAIKIISPSASKGYVMIPLKEFTGDIQQIFSYWIRFKVEGRSGHDNEWMLLMSKRLETKITDFKNAVVLANTWAKNLPEVLSEEWLRQDGFKIPQY